MIFCYKTGMKLMYFKVTLVDERADFAIRGESTSEIVSQVS